MPSENTEFVKSGAEEIWEIINFSGDTHPIHLHQVQFFVLGRGTGVVDDGSDNFAFKKALPKGARCSDPSERIADDACNLCVCSDVKGQCTGECGVTDTNSAVPDSYSPRDTVHVNPEESVRIWVPTPPQVISGSYVWCGFVFVSLLFLNINATRVSPLFLFLMAAHLIYRFRCSTILRPYCAALPHSLTW